MDKNEIRRVLKEINICLTEMREESSESLPLHPPHGVVHFVHQYWHHALEPTYEEAVTEFVEAEARELTPSEAAFTMEGVMRIGLASMFMIGVAFGKHGFEAPSCTCGNVKDSELEALLNGGYGH